MESLYKGGSRLINACIPNNGINISVAVFDTEHILNLFGAQPSGWYMPIKFYNTRTKILLLTAVCQSDTNTIQNECEDHDRNVLACEIFCK